MTTIRQATYTLGPWLTSLTRDHAGHPDAELLALVGQWISGTVECDSISAACDANPMPAALHRLQEALVRCGHRLRDQIARIRPRTADGMKAKALIGMWEAGRGTFEQPPAEDLTIVAWGLARDVLGEDAYREAQAWTDAVNGDHGRHAA